METYLDLIKCNDNTTENTSCTLLTDKITPSAQTQDYTPHHGKTTKPYTLHVLSPATRMFLAARSLCTKDLSARYCMPEAMSLQKTRRVWEVSNGTISPGLI